MSKRVRAQREWNGGSPRVLDDFELGRRERHADASRARGGKRFIGRGEIARALLEFEAAGGAIQRQPEQAAPARTSVGWKHESKFSVAELLRDRGGGE